MPAAPTDPNLRSTFARRGALAFALAFATLAIAALTLAPRANAYVYWTGLDTTTTVTDSVARANLDGSGHSHGLHHRPRLPGLRHGRQRQPIYWANVALRVGIDRGANLDGTNVNESLFVPAGIVYGVAAGGSHLYWADEGASSVRSSCAPTSPRTGPSRTTSTSAGTSAPRWGRRSSGWRSTTAPVYWADSSRRDDRARQPRRRHGRTPEPHHRLLPRRRHGRGRRRGRRQRLRLLG